MPPATVNWVYRTAFPALIRRYLGNLTDRDIRLWRLIAATVTYFAFAG